MDMRMSKKITNHIKYINCKCTIVSTENVGKRVLTRQSGPLTKLAVMRLSGLGK